MLGLLFCLHFAAPRLAIIAMLGAMLDEMQPLKLITDTRDLISPHRDLDPLSTNTNIGGSSQPLTKTASLKHRIPRQEK